MWPVLTLYCNILWQLYVCFTVCKEDYQIVNCLLVLSSSSGFVYFFSQPYAVWLAVVTSCSLWRKCTVDRLKHTPTIFAYLRSMISIFIYHSTFTYFDGFIRSFMLSLLGLGIKIFCMRNVKLIYSHLVILGCGLSANLGYLRCMAFYDA